MKAGQVIHEIPSPSAGALRIIYDFVSPQEEQYLIKKVDDVGGGPVEDPDAPPKAGGWKSLNGRRSMVWGGSMTKSGHLLQTALPDFMDRAYPRVLEKIADTGVFERFVGREGENAKERGPNHCLVNEYLPLQGIMPHTDGPSYTPLVSTLSLSSHTILSLRPSVMSPRSEEVSVFLPRRSLFLLSGDLYEWVHGIEWREADTKEMLEECKNWDEWIKRRLEVEWEEEQEGAVNVRDEWLGLKDALKEVTPVKADRLGLMDALEDVTPAVAEPSPSTFAPNEPIPVTSPPTAPILSSPTSPATLKSTIPSSPSSSSTSTNPTSPPLLSASPNSPPPSNNTSPTLTQTSATDPLSPSAPSETSSKPIADSVPTVEQEVEPEVEAEADVEQEERDVLNALKEGRVTEWKRERRISLTCRRVGKVRDLKSLYGMVGAGIGKKK